MLSKDENTVQLNGQTFHAVDSVPGRCTAGPRCVFAVGFGCDLLKATGEKWCQPDLRADGRSIVWVKAGSREALKTTSH